MQLPEQPLGINIEVTTRCPLRCPQCYCSLQNGRDIPLPLMKKYLSEASQLGVKHVELSGGETLCYPHLLEAIRIARENGLSPSISISGWHFSSEFLAELIVSGIENIHVSLNAPTEKENSKTRDGFKEAIHALEILSDYHFENSVINWVMHRESVKSFLDLIRLAEKYHVSTILIIEPRPNAEGILNTYPTLDDMNYVANLYRHNQSNVELVIQHCFSPLLALSSQNALWGNRNTGVYKGCTAGRYSFCIDVDGNFIPCRHLPIPESFNSCREYWEQSPTLKSLRTAIKEPKEPCQHCGMLPYCNHCIADNFQKSGQLYVGNQNCVIKDLFK